MAQLPSKTFLINYNAKDFDGDRTIPQTQGQTFTEDLQLSSQVTSYTQDHITLNGQYYLRQLSNNPFNRSGNDSLTIIMKVSQGVDTTGAHAIIANRGNDYNWMVFNPGNGSPYGMVFLHSREGDYTKCPYIQMVDTTVPNIFAFRVTGGTGFGKSYTDNQTFTSTGVTWGGSSNSFGIFCGGYSATEFWKGDFYWMYISPEYLTDAEVEEVIAYNEGSSIKAVADNTSFAYSGGIATIDITTINGWSASTTDNWLTLSSSTGSGDTTITVTISNYTGTTDRTDTITFTDTTTGDIAEITIKQKKLVNGQPVYLGSNEVTELYLGSSAVTEAYLGTVLVYSSGPFVGMKVTPSTIDFNDFTLSSSIKVKCSESWTMTVPSWISASTLAGDTGETTITLTATTQTATTSNTITVVSANYSGECVATFTASALPVLNPGEFLCNYNAKEYASGVIPKTVGQYHDYDLNIGNVNSGTGYVTIANKRITFTFASGSDNYFNLTDTATGGNLTVIFKANWRGNLTNTNMFAARTSNLAFSYMIRGGYFIVGRDNPQPQITPSTQPNISFYRCEYTGGTPYPLRAEVNCVTTNQSDIKDTTSTGTSLTAPNGVAFFAGGVSIGEYFNGDFYWIYIAKAALTDAQIQKVIDYNENM